MEQRLTQKQETFCQAVITEASNSDAYRKAYNCKNMKKESVHRLARATMVKVKVASRIDELRAEHAERSAVTVDSLTEELRQILADAKEDRQHAGAVSAVNLIAKMHGMLVDRLKVEPVSIEIKRSYD